MAPEAIGAVLFFIIISCYGRTSERRGRTSKGFDMLPDESGHRSLGQTAAYFAVLVLILIFAAWAKPADKVVFLQRLHNKMVFGICVAGVFLAYMMKNWFAREEQAIGYCPLGILQEDLASAFWRSTHSRHSYGRVSIDASIIPSEYIATL